MSGVRNRTRAVAIDRSERSQLYRVFVIAVSTTLFALMAALGLNAQQVETEKPTEELAMGSVSIIRR